MSEQYTRRRTLKTGAVTGLVVTGGLAGCLGDDSADEDGTNGTGNADGGTDSPNQSPSDTDPNGTDGNGTDGSQFDGSIEFASPSYTDLLYTPSAIDQTAVGYFFNFFDHRQLWTARDQLPGFDAAERVSVYPFAQMGVEYSALRSQVVSPRGSVIRGEFTRDGVLASLETTDFTDSGEYRGYSLWTGEAETRFGTQNRLIAVGDEAVVSTGSVSSNDVGARDAAEAYIDALRGLIVPYVTENKDLRQLTGALGTATSVSGRPREVETTNLKQGAFQGQVAEGRASTLRGETTDVRAVRVFADSDAVTAGEVESWTTTSEMFSNIRDVSISVDGRVVLVTGRGQTAELFN